MYTPRGSECVCVGGGGIQDSNTKRGRGCPNSMFDAYIIIDGRSLLIQYISAYISTQCPRIHPHYKDLLTPTTNHFTQLELPYDPTLIHDMSNCNKAGTFWVPNLWVGNLCLDPEDTMDIMVQFGRWYFKSIILTRLLSCMHTCIYLM